jgi:hypothetical protein
VAGWHGRPARERRRPGRPPRAIRRSVTARRAAGQASRVDGHGVLHPQRLPEPSAPRLHVGRAQDAVHAERQIWRVKRRGPTWRCLPSRAPWTESSGTQLTLTSSWCTSDPARRHDGAVARRPARHGGVRVGRGWDGRRPPQSHRIRIDQHPNGRPGRPTQPVARSRGSHHW